MQTDEEKKAVEEAAEEADAKDDVKLPSLTSGRRPVTQGVASARPASMGSRNLNLFMAGSKQMASQRNARGALQKSTDHAAVRFRQNILDNRRKVN